MGIWRAPGVRPRAAADDWLYRHRAEGIVNAFVDPGSGNVYHPTIFQPSVSHWLDLVNFQTGRAVFNLEQAVPVALTPMVIGIWEHLHQALVDRLGTESIGWQDLLDILNSAGGWADYGVENGRRAVFYGHADPRISSTGLSATIAQFQACAKQNGFTDRRLSLAAVQNDAVRRCVRNLENLVRHYAASTENFLSYIARGPSYLDMLALEETDLICLNRGGVQGDQICNQPPIPLVAIYPKEGTFWHEHPFAILNADWVTLEQRNAARVFTDFTLTVEMQEIIMSEGFRPANPAVPLGFPFTRENGVDINQPTTLLSVPPIAVINEIQQSWSLIKRPADVMILVDVSGSMNNEDRLNSARQALARFLDRVDSRSRVGLMTFSDIVTIWEPPGNLEEIDGILRAYITCQGDGVTVMPNNPLSGKCLRASGSTSLHTALRIAIDVTTATSPPERIRAVLLLSDGQDTCSAQGCATLEDVLYKIEQTRDSLNPVIVIPIAYGSDADRPTLNSYARSSGTLLIDGDPRNIDDLLRFLSEYF